MNVATLIRQAAKLLSASATIALAIVLMPALAGAQDGYPNKPITMIVPFAAGGTTDVIARLVADALRAPLGQPVIIDNRGGAGGTIGTAAVAKAPPDGYTIGMGTASTLAINPAVYKNLSFDVLRDFAFIGDIAAVPNIMSIHPSLPAQTMAEFIAYAKANTGKLAYGSAGNGSVSHLMGEEFRLAIGVDITHVPYRGVGPALNDAIGGQIQILYDNLPSSLPQVAAGKLRALAVSSAERLPVLPDVPTFRELKLDDLDWMAFFGLIAPAATPPAVLAKLNAAMVKALADPELRKKLADQQAIVIASSPVVFRGEVANNLVRFRRAVAAANIRIE